MKSQSPGPAGGALIRKAGIAAVFVVIVVLLLMWLAGSFHHKIETAGATPVPARPLAGQEVVAVRAVKLPAVESAVGTIRAVHETAVASKLLARVLAVNVKAGQPVAEGEVLVQLDDVDLRARLQQSDAAVASAVAARDQARVEFDRVDQLLRQEQAAQIEFDRTQAALKSAEAEVQRAEQTRNEATAILDYATIRAPISGVVIEKKVEAGDTTTPGQVLLTLYDQTRMQLVASVRESLTQRLSVGQNINVHVDALAKTCVGQISEIVPEAESASRSFAVKVTGPCPPGIYSGMFGRLLIPLDEEELLVIPQAAVRRVGQLDVVDAVGPTGQDLERRVVKLGRQVEEDVQILAGLRAGEQVALPR